MGWAWRSSAPRPISTPTMRALDHPTRTHQSPDQWTLWPPPSQSVGKNSKLERPCADAQYEWPLCLGHLPGTGAELGQFLIAHASHLPPAFIQWTLFKGSQCSVQLTGQVIAKSKLPNCDSKQSAKKVRAQNHPGKAKTFQPHGKSVSIINISCWLEK